ncbi:hypothetical protein [Sinanaerobacter sp. ZZT-01]|uniref:hypothetical protein n=1 Tax=Sinanaerobacter sp. ZZT-01 TaxID=3111540 RepID=UPI002D767A00|nr:hypothetical protein [Sinanaerobacter sp. ZZT-01]WRR92090.1 hypothetical protein U5921_08380 [Sinanaerobacter sp. ZZT-01]
MTLIETILWSIFTSIVASFLFWILTFRISRTKVNYSSIIEKSKNTQEYPGEYRYRIKLINSGNRDLIEVSLLAKISLKLGKITNYTYLGIGNDNTLPILHGKRYQKKNAGLSYAHKLTLYPTQTTLNEFKKSFYSPETRTKAKNGTLSLDDILHTYGSSAKISIFVYGNDCLTGARKMFSSPVYTSDKIKLGHFSFSKPLNTKHLRYKQYILDTLRFDETSDTETLANGACSENAQSLSV